MALKVGKNQVALTNPDKILFPADKITKLDLIEYYQAIAPAMLPYTKNRPLTMRRFPNGIDGESFYQKDASEFFPHWIATAVVPKKEGGTTHYVLANNSQTLVYLANLACIEPHLWLSRADKPKTPDQMIFDLDPSKPNDFKSVVVAAQLIRKIVNEHGLVSFVKTTGSRGLHVVIPLRRTKTYDEVKAFAQDIARHMIHLNPKAYTLDLRIAKRGTKIFIDTLRNNYTATAIAPYGVRAKPGAPIATPLHWDELEDKKLTAQSYTIQNIAKRLAQIADPWAEFFTLKQSLAKSVENK